MHSTYFPISLNGKEFYIYSCFGDIHCLNVVCVCLSAMLFDHKMTFSPTPVNSCCSITLRLLSCPPTSQSIFSRSCSCLFCCSSSFLLFYLWWAFWNEPLFSPTVYFVHMLFFAYRLSILTFLQAWRICFTSCCNLLHVSKLSNINISYRNFAANIYLWAKCY